MKAVVFTLGCKVNRYESDVLIQMLIEKGYDVTDELTFADIYILNTCAVTAEAERKSRQAISRCKKNNPSARIFVIGCASQNNAESFAKDNVVYIAGTRSKYELMNYLDNNERIVSLKEADIIDDTTLYTPSRTRSFVKIQDGCNNFCSYCLIPYLRGRSRSRKISAIVEEIEKLSERTPEIVLTGINTMAFGFDNNESLIGLINELKRFDVRIRMSSFYAEGITSELLDSLFTLKKFCPHFHLSLQSGDKDILGKMNRHYTPEIYADKINLIRQYDKNAAIPTDIIVGFPTETEENFLHTYQFCKQMKFSDLHIFPYSSRKGTLASKMEQVDNDLIRDREMRLFELKIELKTEFLIHNIGIEQEVLIEEEKNGYSVGYSRNYTKVYTSGKGTIINVIPQELYLDGIK